ncbi:hypothetical protein ACFQL7_20860 [Halocatena marina]|uniref:Uncharacterized protein n=1 Tax=Halocatena marina TaxID=2934937 RepID=A0ABD5YRK7_9EURY|nr:hypothetical protein [Halocatena marina]
MKEQQFVWDTLDVLEQIIPAKYDVRTAGGDENATPPVCILEWSSVGIHVNGANPFADFTRDQAGDATGWEFHDYSRMELTITVKSYDEGERDTILGDIKGHYVPFASPHGRSFHEDTFEWNIGKATPSSNSIVENDWYVGFIKISCKYVTREQQTGTKLQEVQKNYDVE